MGGESFQTGDSLSLKASSESSSDDNEPNGTIKKPPRRPRALPISPTTAVKDTAGNYHYHDAIQSEGGSTFVPAAAQAQGEPGHDSEGTITSFGDGVPGQPSVREMFSQIKGMFSQITEMLSKTMPPVKKKRSSTVLLKSNRKKSPPPPPPGSGGRYKEKVFDLQSKHGNNAKVIVWKKDGAVCCNVVNDKPVKNRTYHFTQEPKDKDKGDHCKLRLSLDNDFQYAIDDKDRPKLYFQRDDGKRGRTAFFDKVKRLYGTRRRLTQLNKHEDSSPKGRRLTCAELLAQHRQHNPYRDPVVLTRLLDEIKRAQE